MSLRLRSVGDQTGAALQSGARARALHEAKTVCVWATTSKPEWVRAVGALAEVFREDAAGSSLFLRFQLGLSVVQDDEGIVVAQLRERGHEWAAQLVHATPIEPPAEFEKLIAHLRRIQNMRKMDAPASILAFAFESARAELKRTGIPPGGFTVELLETAIELLADHAG